MLNSLSAHYGLTTVILSINKWYFYLSWMLSPYFRHVHIFLSRSCSCQKAFCNIEPNAPTALKLIDFVRLTRKELPIFPNMADIFWGVHKTMPCLLPMSALFTIGTGPLRPVYLYNPSHMHSWLGQRGHQILVGKKSNLLFGEFGMG